MPESVGLDDQAAVAPEEVDLIRPDARVDLWLGKAVATAEGEEETLELAAGEVPLWLQFRLRDQPQIEGSADRTPENRLRNGGMEVAKRASRLGYRDAVAAGRNCGSEGGGAVDRDAAAPPASAVASNGYFDRP
jgi:hypothetical protein